MMPGVWLWTALLVAVAPADESAAYACQAVESAALSPEAPTINAAAGLKFRSLVGSGKRLFCSPHLFDLLPRNLLSLSLSQVAVDQADGMRS